MTPAPDPDPPPLEPARPDDFECCGNGCEPCIFDLHAQAHQRWQREMRAWRERRQAGGGDADVTPAPQPPA